MAEKFVSRDFTKKKISFCFCIPIEGFRISQRRKSIKTMQRVYINFVLEFLNKWMTFKKLFLASLFVQTLYMDAHSCCIPSTKRFVLYVDARTNVNDAIIKVEQFVMFEFLIHKKNYIKVKRKNVKTTFCT